MPSLQAPLANPPDFLELIPMRPDERIDAAAVAAFLKDKLPVTGTPEILQFEGGKANLTYLLRYRSTPQGTQEFVLRRPPLGPVAPSAHDMGREYKVLSVLYQAYPYAPRAYLYSEDTSIVGAPFLVMERRRGIVIRQTMPARFLGQPELMRRMSETIVDVLADLHAVDPKAIGLDTLGKPEGFMARQVKGWGGRWEAAKTQEVPVFYKTWDWLNANLPPAPRTSLVHNDFKLDNMMMDAEDPARCVAVFDWDMCTLGDPLADLGTLLGYWTEAGDSAERAAFAVMPSALPGWYTRREAVRRYGERSGTDLSRIRFYETFAMWKTAVVIQQIYVRLHRGQTQDLRFKEYGVRANALAAAAWELANRKE
ncbi:MAG: phosphotransferase family protein [SAR324 cluster bacterium]